MQLIANISYWQYLHKVSFQMINNSSAPLGIFDSGIGGLTVVNAITKLLPNESIIYFGDTAHTPWGDKSTAAIQAYSIKICDMLLKRHCKVILMACNTASAAAHELVKEYVGEKAIVLNVIDPMVNYLRDHYSQKNVGLIGTKQTVNSNVYKKKLDDLNSEIQLKALATPLLVPIIEEGFAAHPIAAATIKEYLSRNQLQNINALVLACTHYPVIKQHIEAFYQNKIAIIESGEMVAQTLKKKLQENHLLNTTHNSQNEFYVSDYTEAFAATAKLFFQNINHLEQYPLWD